MCDVSMPICHEAGAVAFRGGEWGNKNKRSHDAQSRSQESDLRPPRPHLDPKNTPRLQLQLGARWLGKSLRPPSVVWQRVIEPPLTPDRSVLLLSTYTFYWCLVAWQCNEQGVGGSRPGGGSEMSKASRPTATDECAIMWQYAMASYYPFPSLSTKLAPASMASRYFLARKGGDWMSSVLSNRGCGICSICIRLSNTFFLKKKHLQIQKRAGHVVRYFFLVRDEQARNGVMLPVLVVCSYFHPLMPPLLLFPSIGAISAMRYTCLFAVPRAHRLVTRARAHCECTSMSFIATTCYLCLPQRLWRRSRNKKNYHFKNVALCF
jgi:hypothetical protein